jgi:hypothetical protein
LLDEEGKIMLKWLLERIYGRKIIGEQSKSSSIIGFDPATGKDKIAWVFREGNTILGCYLGAAVGVMMATVNTNETTIILRETFLRKYYRELNEKIRRNKCT